MPRPGGRRFPPIRAGCPAGGILAGLTPVVRLLRASDSAAAAALFAAAYPQRTDEPAWHDDQARRFVTDEVTAYGSVWHVHDQRFRMDLVVRPGCRRRGIGSAMLGRLIIEARAAGAATLQARADSGRAEVLAFLTRRGFAETMRMHHLVLDVASATLAPYADLEPRLAADGIKVTTLAEELRRAGDACWPWLCDAYNAGREGWPDPDGQDAGPERPLTAQEFRARYHHCAGLWPEPCFLAIRDGEYIGFAGPIGTAVRPAMRGRGIATALKVRVIASARERGEPVLDSSTGNPAMLTINQRLGYQRTATEVRLVRPLRPRPGG